jgi:hypothetical protein
MAGPTSARAEAGAGWDLIFADTVDLLMFSIVYGGEAQGDKKPTAVASRGFFVKLLRSTSADGSAGYDDYQQGN